MTAQDNRKTVGMIGLGIMGGAIAANLIARGWTVIGHDLDPARTAALADQGGIVAATAADVANRADLVMTSLPGPAAALAVANEIAGADAPPRIIIELSTLAIADKLQFRDILAAANHTALDCPLSGTGAQALMRDLIVYASGDSAAIEKVLPLFADFSKQSADLGVYGNGSRMKFIANHLVAIHNVASAEAMVLAQRAGLDLQQVVDLVGSGAGGSRIFQLRAPMMASGVFEPATMRISTWQKDMAIITAFADDLGCATPLFDLTGPIYDQAIGMGLGSQDTAAVYTVLDQGSPKPD